MTNYIAISMREYVYVEYKCHIERKTGIEINLYWL